MRSKILCSHSQFCPPVPIVASARNGTARLGVVGSLLAIVSVDVCRPSAVPDGALYASVTLAEPPGGRVVAPPPPVIWNWLASPPPIERLETLSGKLPVLLMVRPTPGAA